MIKDSKLRETQNGPILIVRQEFSLTNASSIVQCNTFLRSLKTGLEIKFENFEQYNNLLQNIAKKLDIPCS